MDQEKLKQALRNLNEEDLKTVRDQCDYLINRGKTNEDNKQQMSQFGINFYFILEKEASRHGISTFPTFSVFEDRHKKSYTTYLKTSDVLERWITDTFECSNGRDLGFIKRLLVKLYFRALCERYENLNFHLIINNLTNIPHEFERAFPGYIGNGLQNMVIKNNK